MGLIAARDRGVVSVAPAVSVSTVWPLEKG